MSESIAVKTGTKAGTFSFLSRGIKGGSLVFQRLARVRMSLVSIICPRLPPETGYLEPLYVQDQEVSMGFRKQTLRTVLFHSLLCGQIPPAVPAL